MLNTTDEEHLRLLSIFHLVAGILYILGGCIPIIHLVLGAVIAFNPAVFKDNAGDLPPTGLGYGIMAIALLAILAMWTFGGLTIYAGRCIKRRSKRLFTQVMAGINCLFVPVGTALGIFTIVVLGRPSIMAAYGLPVQRSGP